MVATATRLCEDVAQSNGFFTPLDLELAAGLPVTRADAARKAVRATRRRTMSNMTRNVSFGCARLPTIEAESSASLPAWEIDFRGIFRLHGECVLGWQVVVDAETGKVLSSGTDGRSIAWNADLPEAGISDAAHTKHLERATYSDATVRS